VKQVFIIGLGQFGMHLARTLARMDCEVLALDSNEARVQEVAPDVQRAVVGDARNAQLLGSLVGGRLEEAIVALGETTIEPSILCVVNLKRLGVNTIRSTARNDDHAMILKAVGATDIIFPERDTATRVARRIANPDLRDMFSLADDYRIMELVAPKRLVGKTLAEADLRKKHDLLVLAVREAGHAKFAFLPDANTMIKSEELLMVLGRELDLARFAGLD
jgi:trk system potassium uptake protein TrkA